MRKIVAVVIAVIIASAVFLAGKNYYKPIIYKDGYDAGYKEAWSKAKTLVDSSILFFESATMNSISGKIKSVSASGKTLTIEADPVSLNPLSDESKPTIRQVRIAPETKIVKRNIASQEEIQKILEEAKDNPAILDPSKPFPPFTEQELAFDGLKTEQRIIISANKDIKTEIDIVAAKIEIAEP
jgi:hypothetical protein